MSGIYRYSPEEASRVRAHCTRHTVSGTPYRKCVAGSGAREILEKGPERVNKVLLRSSNGGVQYQTRGNKVRESSWQPSTVRIGKEEAWEPAPELDGAQWVMPGTPRHEGAKYSERRPTARDASRRPQSAMAVHKGPSTPRRSQRPETQPGWGAESFAYRSSQYHEMRQAKGLPTPRAERRPQTQESSQHTPRGEGRRPYLAPPQVGAPAEHLRDVVPDLQQRPRWHKIHIGIAESPTAVASDARPWQRSEQDRWAAMSPSRSMPGPENQPYLGPVRARPGCRQEQFGSWTSVY